MRIHAIQAFEGDALLVESGGAKPSFMLIDAGPKNTFDLHVRHYLKDHLGPDGALEVVAISHVDGDHILGILDLMAEIERARADEEEDPFVVRDLWHNSFKSTLDPTGVIAQRFQSVLSYAGAAHTAMAEAAVTFLGIPEGARLRRNAIKLGIPLNAGFDGEVICPTTLANPVVSLGDVRLQVVGPTQANLNNLQAEWMAWLDAHENAVLGGDVAAMANADKSVPNLSSIVLLATSASGKTALLTGDARGDHILQGLEASGLMAPGGRLPITLLKVQHHGSDRNIDRTFIKRVPAEIYLFSADGKHGNPDYKTLEWIVEAAHSEGRQIKMIVTNATPSTTKIQQTHPPATYGYGLAITPTTDHGVVIDLT